MSFSPQHAGDDRPTDLPRAVMILAEALAMRHGEVVVAREAAVCTPFAP